MVNAGKYTVHGCYGDALRPPPHMFRFRFRLANHIAPSS